MIPVNTSIQPRLNTAPHVDDRGCHTSEREGEAYQARGPTLVSPTTS